MTSRRRAAGLVVVVLLAGSLAACSSDPSSLAEQAKSGDRKGYAAGDGSWEKLASARRGDPVLLSGTTVDGRSWSRQSDAVGKVVVVNVWGAWCAPCVAETPDLQRLWSEQQAAAKPVAFLGISVKEPPENAASFLRKNGVTYPSLSNDASGGQPLLALQGKAPTTPATLVLDPSGRIAARILGPISVGTLRGLIDDTLADP